MRRVICYTEHMKIGIDARLFGPTVGGGGLGRYVEELLKELAQQDTQANRYVVFVKPASVEDARAILPADQFEIRAVDIHWYTLKEQFQMGRIIDAEGLDLVHIPHWNVSLFQKTPYVLTIHDLILLEEPMSARATTKGPLVHALKTLGFRLVLNRAIRRARLIIAPSAYTKESILRFFRGILPETIHVIHEGIATLPEPEPKFTPPSSPFLLAVGNAYPHKNLETLLAAFAELAPTYPALSLVFAGREDVFSRRLEQRAALTGFGERVRFIRNPSDAELAALYAAATIYVFPSRIEGFGLPPLEAMAHGVPVIAAQSSCLPEILGTAAHYFPPNNASLLAEEIRHLLSDETLRNTLILAGYAQAQLYSWKTMAKETRTLYETVH